MSAEMLQAVIHRRVRGAPTVYSRAYDQLWFIRVQMGGVVRRFCFVVWDPFFLSLSTEFADTLCQFSCPRL